MNKLFVFSKNNFSIHSFNQLDGLFIQLKLFSKITSLTHNHIELFNYLIHLLKVNGENRLVLKKRKLCYNVYLVDKYVLIHVVK